MTVASGTHSRPPGTLKRKWRVLHECRPLMRATPVIPIRLAHFPTCCFPVPFTHNYKGFQGQGMESFLLPHRNHLFRPHSFLPSKVLGQRAHTANATVLPWRCLFCHLLDLYQTKRNFLSLSQEPSSALNSLGWEWSCLGSCQLIPQQSNI